LGIVECIRSLATAVQWSQIADVLAIVNAYHTDEDGTIELIIDGERLWMRVRN